MTNEQILAQPEPRCPLCEFQYFSRSKWKPREAYAEFGEHLFLKHGLDEFFSWDLIHTEGRDERIAKAYMQRIFK